VVASPSATGPEVGCSMVRESPSVSRTRDAGAPRSAPWAGDGSGARGRRTLSKDWTLRKRAGERYRKQGLDIVKSPPRCSTSKSGSGGKGRSVVSIWWRGSVKERRSKGEEQRPGGGIISTPLAGRLGPGP